MLRFPRNIWVLAIVFSLVMTSVSLLVLVGGLVGSTLAPSAQLATLPMAIFVVGNALATIPSAMISKALGRKLGAYIGLSLSLLAALICAYSLYLGWFSLFVAGAFFTGCGTAFYHQFRFAAIESLSNKSDAGPAMSLIMLCSIVGAIIGPELGTYGRDLLPNQNEYIASFVMLAGLIIIAMLIFSLFCNPASTDENNSDDARPLVEVVFQPGFLVALAAAAIGYSLMSFLMTSTPISMHVIQGLSLDNAKWVIQSHLAAMFLPSLFSGLLIKRFGPANIMLVGSCIYLAVIAVALSGHYVIHYWWALVLLGLGWNFLFLSGSAMLPNYYRHSERFKAQAINDFSVFTLQAGASLCAAWVLYSFGWHIQVWLCLPPTLLMLAAAIWARRHNKTTI